MTHRKDTCTPGRSDGFTLVEVLVGLALLALITSFLAPILFEARRALRIVDRPNLQTQVAAAQAYLRNGITQTYPAIAGIVGDQSGLGILGSAASITYATTYAAQNVYQGLYRITVLVVPNAQGGQDLVADERLYRADSAQQQGAPSRRLRLLENVAGITFSYFTTRQTAEDDQPWQREWQATQALPELVAIGVAFPAGDTRVWPTFWVRPAAAGTSGVRCPPRVYCD